MSGVHSPTYKINFFYIPKCACTVTRQLWYHLHAEDMVKAEPTYHWHYLTLDFPPAKAGSVGYVAIRHPYYRTVSMYTNRFCGEYQDSIATRKHMSEIMPEVPMTFHNFCRYLALCKENAWKQTNVHFLPQVSFLKNIEPLLLIRCQEKHELTGETQNQNMCRQYKDIYHKLLGHSDLDAQIDSFFAHPPIQNATPRTTSFDPTIDYTTLDLTGTTKFPPADTFLTAETKSLIQTIYETDFTTFKYSI